jgi:hypothetical protein
MAPAKCWCVSSGVAGLLHVLNWLKFTDVSGRIVGRIIGVSEKLFGNPDYGIDKTSRNVSEVYQLKAAH